jgi:hypothetical protein
MVNEMNNATTVSRLQHAQAFNFRSALDSVLNAAVVAAEPFLNNPTQAVEFAEDLIQHLQTHRH